MDIDVSLEELSSYPVLVISSGGLFGLSSLESFKSKLEQYVSNGGTLVIFTQQHGYEFDAAPGDLDGYGWLEDQSCQYRSVGINTYHPTLSGQDSVISDVNRRSQDLFLFDRLANNPVSPERIEHLRENRQYCKFHHLLVEQLNNV